MAVDVAEKNNSVAQSAASDSTGEIGLVERYLPLVRSRANTFRQKGVEIDDLIQEGVIGLLYAIRAYDHKYETSFETFAYVCITNRLRSAVASVHKKLPVISLESYEPLADSCLNTAQEEDPQEIVISRDQLSQWLDNVDVCLSKFEHQVIRYYLGGYSYSEIAQFLQSTTKAVDNALQRARRKLRRL